MDRGESGGGKVTEYVLSSCREKLAFLLSVLLISRAPGSMISRCRALSPLMSAFLRGCASD